RAGREIKSMTYGAERPRLCQAAKVVTPCNWMAKYRQAKSAWFGKGEAPALFPSGPLTRNTWATSPGQAEFLEGLGGKHPHEKFFQPFSGQALQALPGRRTQGTEPALQQLGQGFALPPQFPFHYPFLVHGRHHGSHSFITGVGDQQLLVALPGGLV